jgi:isoleucyl-tRNA synthetase
MPESPTLDLKKTVNLPKTAFAMKANLPQAEPKTLARWQSEDLYGQIRAARAGRPTYILHDGPPYANGNIHLGHALNKLLKDFVVKVKTMEGFDSPYVPGWDCHGLPIEIKIDNELGSKKAQMTTAQIRAACRKYAGKYIDLQLKAFVRLGVFGSWENYYSTMSAAYESVIAGAFVDFLDKGYIYKGLKPVNWCIHDRTALAEAEVAYENKSSPTIWVRFALKTNPIEIDPSLAGRKVYGLIWTTTPWTIPANLGIAYHPKYEYVAAEVDGEVYIVALELLKATAEKCGWAEPKVLAAFPGSKLEGAVFAHPFLERDSLGMLADYVTLDQGTGAVHTAPGHGQDDYVTGMRYGLPVFCPVDAAGRFFHAEGAPGILPEEIIGKRIWEANPIVVEILKAHGALSGFETIEHSYPHCWRCHNATIFRATEQWFIGMDRNDLRNRALHAIKQVSWHPKWGEERISNMVATRPDWCISRQRAWGVPITVFYCEQCREPLTDRRILDRVVKLFAEHTADVWYERSAADLIGEEVKCSRCAHTSFTKETDILDVWFDSGSSHLAVLNEKYGLPWPSDIYLEGGDQYRGWFQSSLLVGVGLKGEAPFRACATSGWTLDEHGKAMSKSLGNTIEPEDIIKEYGSDIVRLWVASVDFTEDVTLSKTILARLSEAYRKLRNTFRYALGNLDGFDPTRDLVASDELHEIDQWILVKAEDLVSRCRRWYDELAYHKVYQAVYSFATTELSSVYFDVVRDRLYTTGAKSVARRSAQTALHRITYALVRLLAPLLAFTCEEIWGHLGGKGSVHTQLFPEPEELTQRLSPANRTRLENWPRLMQVREEVLKVLGDARDVRKLIGSSLEARVRLQTSPLLKEYQEDLPALFIVSEVSLEDGIDAPVVELAPGAKCERCWKHLRDVGSAAEFPSICGGCAEVVREILSTHLA